MGTDNAVESDEELSQCIVRKNILRRRKKISRRQVSLAKLFGI